LISQQNIDENERPTMELHPVLQALKPVIKGMALAMGPDYEIVLHDIADPDNSIIAIENSHVTGRKIGDSLTDYAMYLLKTSDQKKKDFVANFLTRTKEGKRIRSSTLYLRDEDGRLIGYLCINYDMSKAEIIRNMVEQLVNVTGGTEAIPREEEMPSTLEGLMERNLKLIRRLVGKPLHMSSKQE
jgi:predicted transcriptional regulator YheO